MEGIVFSDYEIIRKSIGQTATGTGLTVVVRLNLNRYETGIKTDKSELDPKRILYHPAISELNYRILP
jgi:hypothetical protein